MYKQRWEVKSMANRNHSVSLTLAGVLLLISAGMFGCSETNTETNKSAAPAKGTMPELNITKTPTKPAPTEQAPVTEKAPTETTPAEAVPPTTPAVEPVPLGEKVFKSGCIACHGTGAAGAPKFGDAALWKDRIAKGKDALLKNAITGFTGSTGTMPPKGGFVHLSDEEIAAAVEYMMKAAQ